MKLFGKLVCAVTKKHKRGKKVAWRLNEKDKFVDTFACPRCGAEWERKVRKPANAAV